MTNVDPYELQENSPGEISHFKESLSDYRSTFEQREFRAWNGRTYICEGHFPCGFHMRPKDGIGRWHCISERAIGRTYHQVSP